ncbi:polysaccharide deacetylase family protein [Paenibacillus sp. N1-5-1-14]|uniref:polysaccharide deacetylase family protein n=1 Tax=Paenibacillus radicibacter TaxID=2972488 RepID=UPI00215948A1|nr:polysaccharide deacetylase family protein [Paenibacillus radicibacter]MCR8641800.1 polysaccharide deacetylase family protein [Paenibacillus radicibacter]
MEKRRFVVLFSIALGMSLLAGCAGNSSNSLTVATQTQSPSASAVNTATPQSLPSALPSPTPLPNVNNSFDRQKLMDQFAHQTPTQWGERVSGVRTRLQTTDKVIALTFDACGGGQAGNGYDKELIDYLIQEQIPATLFINARWIDTNADLFQQLASNSLFELENHGHEHRPLSVTGRSIYNIVGTKSVSEVIDEVKMNADKIESLTGRRPLFFRSGTAYYDEIAVKVVQALGMQAVNFNVLGDAGATYNTDQIDQALTKSKPGSIVLMHMNHPEKSTAEGVMKAVPKLKLAGFSFVKLSAYRLE